MKPPRRWLLTDAPYAGGAERYLQLLLDAAGPEELGVVGVAHAGLCPWLDAREAEGFVVDRLEASSLRAQWRQLWNWARMRRPRLVHVNMPGPYDGMMATAPWIAKRAGVERVLTTEHLPGVGRVGRRYHWKRLLAGAIDRAIVVCHAHHGVMTRVFGYDEKRVIPIPNGIADPASTRPRGEVRGPLPVDLVDRETRPGVRIVQLGSLDARKGPDRILRAFAQLREADMNVSLWFVGDGPERAATEELARGLGVADDVHLLGHRDDAPTLLAASDVVTLASVREGLPFSLIEAAAWARPIVALDTDGVGEIVIDGVNGRLVPTHRPDAFARALHDLCEDAPRRHAWGDAGRRRFEEHFGLDRMLERTFALYDAHGGRDD